MSYFWNQAYRSPYSAYGIVGDQYSHGSVLMLPGAAYADGNTIILATKTYEIDVGGGGVTPGNEALVITGAETAEQMAQILLAAASFEEPLLHIERNGATVLFSAIAPGPEYVIGTGGGWPVESIVASILGGEVGTGQPARFGPVRAMHIGSGDGRMVG